MIYNVIINKKYRYIRVYEILKKIGKEGGENKLSKAFEKFVNRFFVKEQM